MKADALAAEKAVNEARIAAATPVVEEAEEEVAEQAPVIEEVVDEAPAAEEAPATEATKDEE